MLSPDRTRATMYFIYHLKKRSGVKWRCCGVKKRMSPDQRTHDIFLYRFRTLFPPLLSPGAVSAFVLVFARFNAAKGFSAFTSLYFKLTIEAPFPCTCGKIPFHCLIFSYSTRVGVKEFEIIRLASASAFAFVNKLLASPSAFAISFLA